MGVSLKETHAEGVLQLADRARDDRVRDGEFIRRLRHAPGLCDRKQNVQIAQFDPPSDPIVPAHAYPLAKLLIRCRDNSTFQLRRKRARWQPWKSSATMEAHMSPKRSSHFVGLLFASMALGCSVWPLGAAAEQPYPNRLIKIIYSEVAGGPTDIVTRTIADKMSISLK